LPHYSDNIWPVIAEYTPRRWDAPAVSAVDADAGRR
jgi:hypothetical protein